MDEDRMNGRERERRTEGNMYVFFVFLFLVSNTGEGSEEEVCGWEMPTFFILFLHRDIGMDTCRMSTRKMSCKGNGKRSGIRLANGSRIKMQVCQVFSLLSCLTCIRFRMKSCLVGTN